MLAVAMAEGGQTIANAACRYTNMTDACCIAGVKFPTNLSDEVLRLLEWFDKKTSKMCVWWRERDEEARYCLVGEILVKLVDGVSVEDIRAYIDEKLTVIRKEVGNLQKRLDGAHYDDVYGFDDESIYLTENNWGCDRRHLEREECDWFTRRAS